MVAIILVQALLQAANLLKLVQLSRLQARMVRLFELVEPRQYRAEIEQLQEVRQSIEAQDMEFYRGYRFELREEEDRLLTAFNRQMSLQQKGEHVSRSSAIKISLGSSRLSAFYKAMVALLVIYTAVFAAVMSLVVVSQNSFYHRYKKLSRQLVLYSNSLQLSYGLCTLREIIYGREIDAYEGFLAPYTDRAELVRQYLSDFSQLKTFIIEGLSSTDFSAFPNTRFQGFITQLSHANLCRDVLSFNSSFQQELCETVSFNCLSKGLIVALHQFLSEFEVTPRPLRGCESICFEAARFAFTCLVSVCLVTICREAACTISNALN